MQPFYTRAQPQETWNREGGFANLASGFSNSTRLIDVGIQQKKVSSTQRSTRKKKTLHGPKADPVELNLWTMIPMSTTTQAMLDPEANKVDEQTDTEGLY
jgi:hypothetical protein